MLSLKCFRFDFTILFATVAAFHVAAFHVTASFADVVKLKNGGEVRGSLINDDSFAKNKKLNPVRIETLRGTIIEIAREDIDFVSRRRLAFEIYEIKAAKTPKTIEDQWKLANWCRENRLVSQSKKHIRKVIELAPNHKKARISLGYQQVNGGWMTRDEILRSRGLVKFQGKYITPEEMEIRVKSQDVRKKENNWYKKISRWTKALTGRNPENREKFQNELLAIKDPFAVSALVKILAHRKERTIRIIYVQILAGISGEVPVGPLATQSLYDVDASIRAFSFRGISSERHRQALPYFIQGLKNPNNQVVQRAAIKLGEIGLTQSIPALIVALTTFHDYKIQVPDNRSMSFNSNGSSGSNNILQRLPPEIITGLRNGQYPYGVVLMPNSRQPTVTVTIKLEQPNREVLNALKKLTGENYLYDKRTWLLWHEANKVGFLKKRSRK